MSKKIQKIVIIICVAILLVNLHFLMVHVNENEKIKQEIKQVENSLETFNNNVDGGDVIVRVYYAEGFYYEPISDALKERINGKSYKENDKINYSDLRYLTMQYIDFDGNVQTGEMIVNVQIAEDVLAIFKELFDKNYKIEKIKLIDDYNADDDASMSDNNTSAFNYRNIDGTDKISDHSYGIAIDINPLYNPYVREGYGERDVLPVEGTLYADRERDFQHKIVKGDECYMAFISRGFKWGGEWDDVKDYQHFYKELK